MRVLCWHFGRNGAGPKLNFEMAKAFESLGVQSYSAISSSASNKLDYDSLVNRPLLIDTYENKSQFVVSTFFLAHKIKIFKKYLVDNKIDVVLCTMPHLWNSFFERTIKELGIIYVICVHDAEPHYGEAGSLIKNALLFRHDSADFLVTFSDFVKAQILQKKKNKYVLSVPHGLMDYGVKSLRLYDNSRPLKLVFFGRIHKYKGISLLLSSYRELKEKSAKVELTIYGSGDASEFLLDVNELGINLHNRWIDDDEIGDLLNAHHLCILPYVEGTQSGVIPTAIANGLPVVISPIAGLKEQVEHMVNGIVLKDISSSAITEAIELFISNPSLLESLSKNCLINSDIVGSWSVAAERIVGDIIRYRET